MGDPLGSPELLVRHRQPIEGQIGAFGSLVDDLLPDAGGLGYLVVAGVDVAEIQVGGYDVGVKVDRGIETRHGAVVVASGHGLQSQFILEKCQDRLAAHVVAAAVAPQRPSDVVRFLPLVLIFVQFFDVEQRVMVVGSGATPRPKA